MNKKYGILIFSIIYFFTLQLSAQERPIDLRFNGKEEAFIRHMRDNLKYPKESLEKNIIGYSITSLTISPEGDIRDVKTLNPLDDAIDSQVTAALLKTQGKWLKSDSIKTDQTFYVQVIYQIIKIGYDATADLKLRDIYNFLEPVYVTSLKAKGSPYIQPIEALGIKISEDMKNNRLEDAIRSVDELIRRNPFIPDLYQLRISLNSRLKNNEPVTRDTRLLQNFLPGVSLHEFITTYEKEEERIASELSKDSILIAEHGKIDQMPEFPGGNQELMNFIVHNLEYPVAASAMNYQGEVQVKFVVGRNGLIRNVQIAKGVHPILDAEAMRVISLMPRWKPAIQNGKPVNVYFVMPIRFILNR